MIQIKGEVRIVFNALDAFLQCIPQTRSNAMQCLAVFGGLPSFTPGCFLLPVEVRAPWAACGGLCVIVDWCLGGGAV